MKLICGKPRLTTDYITGKPILLFPVCSESKRAAIELCGESYEKLTVEAKKYRRKRSLNANAYFWKLAGKLSDKLGIPSGEIYRQYIKEYGVFQIVEINEAAAATLSHSWELNGIGWFTEKVDYGARDGFVLIKLYYGSSSYNTKQMSRLIDAVVQDCIEQGIETMTPKEIALLKEGWVSEKCYTA